MFIAIVEVIMYICNLLFNLTSKDTTIFLKDSLSEVEIIIFAKYQKNLMERWSCEKNMTRNSKHFIVFDMS